MVRTSVSLRSTVKYFESLPDPRHEVNRKHLLGDIIAICICGVISGCEGPTAIARWANAKETWLRTVLELPNGVPSRDCIRRVLSLLKPEAFQECFARWVTDLFGCAEKPLQRMVAIDGKTMRRSHDRRDGLGPLHLVSAWATEHGISLGQVATEEKSNEITAIDGLLDKIDMRGTVISIDAIACQKKIAQKIVDGGGDYVLAVKANQPKLLETVREFFTSVLEKHHSAAAVDYYESHEQLRGRTEDRCYYVAKLRRGCPLLKQWRGITSIRMVIRTTQSKDGRTSEDVRYFISSRNLTAEGFAKVVRGHWRIENSLHWVLDVTFNEDQSRTRDRRLADNLAWLRRFAITLLKQHPSTESIKGKSQIAGWNTDFLTEVLYSARV